MVGLGTPVAIRKLRIIELFMPGGAPMTVVETGEFLSRAKPLMTDEERTDLVLFLAANPEA